MSIHILYDPNDRVTGLSVELLKDMGVSSVIFRGNVTKDRIEAVVNSLAILLLREITKDNPNANKG